MIRNNQNRRRRGGNNNNGPRPQQMNGGNNYGNRLDNRQRGNASQLLEKYRSLARDAQQAGDRVTAEYYLQYADHYYRVLGDYRDKTPDQNSARRDNFDDDSAGFANGNDGDDGDDEDDDGGRSEVRAEAPRGDVQRNEQPRDGQRNDGPRNDGQREERGNWRDDRPNGNRDRNFRDGNRDQPRRDGEASRDGNRDGYRDQPRDGQRDGGQREIRREGGNRDRQGWNNDRNRDGNREGGERPVNRDGGERVAEAPRANDRPNDRPGVAGSERRERYQPRPEPVRPAFVEEADEGPIPGLPGPATLRLNRSEAAETAPRAERAPRVRREPVLAEAAAPVVAVPEPVAVEAEAPKRRGRPRKVVDEAVAEG